MSLIQDVVRDFNFLGHNLASAEVVSDQGYVLTTTRKHLNNKA